MSPPPSVSAAVLVGGRSVRMGADKASLNLAGQSLLELLVDRLGSCFKPPVMVVARAGQQLPKLPVTTDRVEDLASGGGPLVGLHAALSCCSTSWVFLTACDLPLLSPALVSWICSLPVADQLAVVPYRDGRPEPLHALYHRDCLPHVEDCLARGVRSLKSLLKELPIKVVQEDCWREHEPSGNSFLNVNRPEDLERARLLLSVQSVTVPL
ncbi:MAG: hypothetical protein CMP23_01365 [Rickettsiales bacterium]|nr:hypothetical protein [Rickettsiales bacterium]